MKRLLTSMIAACAVALCVPSYGQTPPETILTIEADKTVFYYDDLADPTKRATVPTPVPVTALPNFMGAFILADIVTVNGQPARGALVARGAQLVLRPGPTGSQGIADINRNNLFDFHFEIQQADGTPIGSIVAMGLGAGHPPLDAPTSAAAGNFAVVGGTGAFQGVRGSAATVSAVLRSASMAENPINRQANTGPGIWKVVVHLIPLTRPAVMIIPTGPAVFHATDFSPVTTEKPARTGEWLIMNATGLGPVRPRLDPGEPFPEWMPGKEYLVNSPLKVTVGGQTAEVRNAIGWPGQTNVYRVDFRVPDGVKPGLASLSLTAAWIAGTEVKIPVQ